MAETTSNRCFYLVLAGFIFLHLVLLNSLKLYPFADLPNHLAEAAIYRYSGQSDNQFAQYYPIQLAPYANIFYILFMACPLFPSVEFGARIFYDLYVVLLPLSIWTVINRRKGDPWWTLLAFLFMYNYDLCWGLSAFTFFIPVFFLFLSVMIRHLEENRIVNDFLIGLIFMMLYFMHIMGLLFSLLVFMATVIYRYPTSLRWIIRKSIPALPILAAILIVSQSGIVSGLGKFFSGYYLVGQCINLLPRLREFLVFDNYFLYPARKGEIIALLFVLVIVVSVLIRHAFLFRNKLFQKAWSQAGILLPLLICALLCFFLLPPQIPGHDSPYQRFSSIFFLGLIVYGGSLIKPSSGRMRLMFCGMCLFHYVLWANCLLGFDKENRGFNQSFFPSDTHDKILSGLIFDKKYRRLPAYIHFPNYYIVWRRGIAATALVHYGYNILDNDLPRKELPVYDEWVSDITTFDENKLKVDYLLVNGLVPAQFKNYFDRHFKVLREAGQWRLYERQGK